MEREGDEEMTSKERTYKGKYMKHYGKEKKEKKSRGEERKGKEIEEWRGK